TDLHNQISLCTAHHDGIDRGDHTITGNPNTPDGLVVTNRHGLTIRPPRPADTAPPPGGDPQPPPGTYQPPSGGPITWTDIALPPDSHLGQRRLTVVPPEGAPEPEPEFVSWLDDPANPDRGLIRVL
ncbi:hypothetical protein AB4Z02_16905, partial [Pedococcus sp. 2YAF34]